MMFVLTPEEADVHRKRQVQRVSEAIRSTIADYPGTDPSALTRVLTLCERDYGLLDEHDFSEARKLAT